INDTTGMGERPAIPASFWAPPYGVGKGIKIVARGIVSSTATPTFTFSVRLGTNGSVAGPLVGGTGALTTISGAASRVWELELDVIMRSIGTAGANSTVQGIGTLRSAGLATVVADVFGGAATPGTVATVDASIVNYVNISAAC